MVRRIFATAGSTLALVAASLVLAGPAQAGWSTPGNLTDYRLCRTSTTAGDTWRFMSEVTKRDDTPDARAVITVLSRGKRADRWSSGWLDDDTRTSTVRVRKSFKVKVQIQQEAGDRDSTIGTAAELTVLKPRKIRHC